MQKIIAIIASWCLVFQVSAQPNIIRAEYFIDTDPGFGNAISISITPSTNIINNTFSVPASSLTKGVHILYIRSLDANGKWSISNPHVFYNFGLPVNIITAEYFIDTDPGFGNATNITITPGLNLSNNTFSIPVSPIMQGVHTLFLRSMDANGNWSVTNPHVFYNFGSSLITRAEYFIDADPGFGNGNTIPLTPSVNITAGAFTIPAGALVQGVHTLYLRSQDGNGRWSITNQHVFINFGSLDNITRWEYFIDTDPGFGNAVPVSFNPSINISDFITQVNITGLSVGNHRLYVRSRTDSKWSITNEYDFPIVASASLLLYQCKQRF